MASARVLALRKHLCCSICLELYTDPVTLPCQHHFCKQCIQRCLETYDACPMCRAHAPIDETRPVNRTLRDMADEMRAEIKASVAARGTKPAVAPKPKPPPQNNRDCCQAHREPLGLYCETDRSLVCVVCRDGTAHRGHRVKPVEEAREEIAGVLMGALFDLQEDIAEVENHQLREGALAEKARERNTILRDQLKIRFDELHELLHQKEEQAVKETDELEARSSRQLVSVRQVLEEGRGRQAALKAGWRIQDPLDFLRWWAEEGHSVASEDLYCNPIQEPQQGPLMRKCPPASLERGGESQLQSLVGFLAAENLEKFLSRHINPPVAAAASVGRQPAVPKRERSHGDLLCVPDIESRSVYNNTPLPTPSSLTTQKKPTKSFFEGFWKK